MEDATTLDFAFQPHASPVPADVRAGLLANPGFGKTITDHMVVINYAEGRGWHDARVVPYGPLSISPACAVLHYAQEIFEGLKAYRLPDGGAALFRPEANARRFNESADRMAMPRIPEALFLAALHQMVRADGAWIPEIEGGSLYLRPFMFASENFLGVKPASEFLFIVIASPAGSYFKDADSVTLWVSEHYTRAAPGGTGAAKCGGNYASSLIAQAEAIREGCHQVVFLDAAERKWVEELGGMNVMFAFDDGSIQTPPLGGTILPGITRDSLLTLARDAGFTVREEPYSIDQWQADAASGRLREAFACGTAAVVTPIGKVRGRGFEFSIGNQGPGLVAQKFKDQLVAIQRGRAPDPHGWLHRLS
ncbi:branched-chain amino acid aminotransferase [Sphingomonas canadensis]|uniref:Probable branched-chain-amino-acid aminotransferase n=1 Tax=Sphingomonas canadensis TaxID=1219257 RepID=A0ABW3H8J5_9SPHN|nr:branched-chain amino acid aminotransferase [Sphingomonas canadensis]MCW3837021.1 branched-chain amino acid aminotransferase [Sphingomonas canadensis]